MSEIKAAQELPLSDEDGDPIELELGPAPAPADIDALESSLGLRLPTELREVLAFTRSIEGGPVELIDFTGEPFGFEASELFPRGVPIAADGFGNFWIADLASATPETVPVYFACHDPPVVLKQSETLAGFLHEVFRMAIPPHESLVDDVHEDRLHDVWRSGPGAIAHDDARTGDAALAGLAADLDERYTFFDLRRAPAGMGFAWGRHGHDTLVVRHEREPIFAVAAPERRPGRLRRFLSR